MRKFLFICILALVMMMASSCAPREWFLMNSSGIFTYNRHTGQVELLWETQGGAGVAADTMNHSKNSVPPSEVEK